jgi:5-bromo-4-chloroindolyl phosphate hydrolysis protein
MPEPKPHPKADYRGSADIQEFIQQLNGELKEAIRNSGIAQQEYANIRREILEAKSKLGDLTLKGHDAQEYVRKGKEIVRIKEIEIKENTAAFWQKKNDGE